MDFAPMDLAPMDFAVFPYIKSFRVASTFAELYKNAYRFFQMNI